MVSSMNLFKMRYTSLVEGIVIEDENADVKSGKTVGQYKVSANAIYRPDGKYIPFSTIEEVVQDKGTVHVTGCCIGAVAVDRLVVTAGGKKYAFAFDSEKDAKYVRECMEQGK